MDKKRELFKRYLEEKKVVDQLSKIVVAMYETSEKPQDPLLFIQDYLSSNEEYDLHQIRLENTRMTKQLSELQAKLDNLNKSLETHRKK